MLITFGLIWFIYLSYNGTKESVDLEKATTTNKFSKTIRKVNVGMIKSLVKFLGRAKNKNKITKDDLLMIKIALENMNGLSKKLNEENFCRMFNAGLNVLALEELSNKQKAEQILVKTQVFGGMGSWNDCHVTVHLN